MSLFEYLELKRKTRELQEDMSADYVALTKAGRTREKQLNAQIDQLRTEIDELRTELIELKVHLGIIPPPEPPKEPAPEPWTKELKKEPPKAPETFSEMLAYAARFETDDGMTAYLEKIAAELPEEDRRTVENLLLRSPAEIRKELGRRIQAE